MITVLVAIVFAGAGFFGGMQYQKSLRTAGLSGAAGAARFGRGAGLGGNRGNATMGQIISDDGKTLTVKLNDGSSKIVILSSTTAINKQATGSASDLKAGETVAVFGQTNTDGSVTATNIQLRAGIPQGQVMNPISH